MPAVPAIAVCTPLRLAMFAPVPVTPAMLTVSPAAKPCATAVLTLVAAVVPTRLATRVAPVEALAE